MTFDFAFFEMLKASIIADIKAIDYNKTSFKLSVFFMLFNPIFWNTVAQLEFRKKVISRFTGPQIGCYLLAAVIFSLGLVRDFMYEHDPLFSFDGCLDIIGQSVSSRNLRCWAPGCPPTWDLP